MPIFREASDYLVYLSLLREAIGKSGSAVHAYCLMPNHVHLLVTTASSGACGLLMHSVAQRYSQYFNRARDRSGTLWEGRYRSCIVQSARYVLACYRYIELNPVRAGLVSHPGGYPWSSHAANAGAETNDLVSPHADYLAIGNKAYLQLFSEPLDAAALERIRDATNGDLPLASEAFKGALAVTSGRKMTPGRPGRPKKGGGEKSVDVPDLFSGGGAS